jgi:hypothetical protein
VRYTWGTVKLEWAEHGLEAELAFPTELAAQEETHATTTR